MVLSRLAVVPKRAFGTSLVRQGGYTEGPGSNMPFPTKNKWVMLGVMAAFFGSGFAFPFILVRHQLLKK